MIYVNLKHILQTKDININQLSESTGISRNSLTSLSNNQNKMIQFETLDKLIQFLNVSIEDLLRYVPNYAFNMKDVSIDFQKKIITGTLYDTEKVLQVKTYARFTHENDIYHIRWPYIPNNERPDSFDQLFTQVTKGLLESGLLNDEKRKLESVIRIFCMTFVKEFMIKNERLPKSILNLAIIVDFQLQPIPFFNRKDSKLKERHFIREMFSGADVYDLLQDVTKRGM